MSLFDHFFQEARIWICIRIRIRAKSRIRIRIKKNPDPQQIKIRDRIRIRVIGRIRIRINVMWIHNTACALTTGFVMNFNGILVTEVFPVPEDVRPPVCELEDTLLQPLQEDGQPDILSGGDGQQAGPHKVPQFFRLDRSNIYKLKNNLTQCFRSGVHQQ
jgi:hypothetical protein